MTLVKTMCKYKDNDIIVNISQYGHYVKCDNIKATIFGKSMVFDITEDEIKTLINKKEQLNSNKNKN